MKLFTIPNLITLGNLTCGIIGIWCVFSFKIEVAAVFIIAAAVLDFFDGFFARLLKSYSDIGKELDSLADMVSFGVLPSFILYYLLSEQLQSTCSTCITPNPWILLSILPALFSALRLAKFNVDTRQSDGFIGLNTPSNAVVVASFVLIGTFQSSMAPIFLNAPFLITYCIVVSILMVSEIPMASLKFKNFTWKDNKERFMLVMISIVLALLLKFASIPAIIALYVISSIITKYFLSRK